MNRETFPALQLKVQREHSNFSSTRKAKGTMSTDKLPLYNSQRYKERRANRKAKKEYRETSPALQPKVHK